MPDLPVAKIYQEEMRCFPWGEMIERVVSLVAKEAPSLNLVVDVMCGTGFLLERLFRLSGCQNLRLAGIDINGAYLQHARRKVPKAVFFEQDVMSGDYMNRIAARPDCIICTGSLHHLDPSQQKPFVQKMASWLKPDGVLFLADSCIGEYTDEQSRKQAAAELGYQYLKETITRGGSDGVIQAAIDVLQNDVFQTGEYKLTRNQFVAITSEFFPEVECHKVWPEWDSDYGDYYLVLRK